MTGASQSDSFNLFYRENFPRIYKYSYRFVGNSEEAEQLTQEAFKNLYAALVNGKRVSDMSALAFRITHNICINYLKRDKRQKSIIMQRTQAHPESVSSTEDSVIAKQQLEFLRQSILGLPKRDQQCLFLYLEGFSYNEIATIVHIRRTSIGKILARAVNNLSSVCQRGEPL